MQRPMCRYHPHPRNPTILHLHIRLQPLGHSLGDDGALVLLQSVDLCLDVSGEGIDLGALGIKIVSYFLLFVDGRLKNE